MQLTQSSGQVTVLDSKALERALTRICYEIVERNEGLDQLVIVGIRTRGAYLAQRMAAKLSSLSDVDVPISELDITLYRDDLDPNEHRERPQNPVLSGNNVPRDLAGKTVVAPCGLPLTPCSTLAGPTASCWLSWSIAVTASYRSVPISSGRTSPPLWVRLLTSASPKSMARTPSPFERWHPDEC